MSIESKEVLLIGAGGHAKVVYDTLCCIDPSLHIHVRDDNPTLEDHRFFDLCIKVPSFPDSNSPIPVHIAIGNNAARKKVAKQFLEYGYKLLSVVHPTSSVSPHAQVAEGVLIAAHSVIGPSAVVGEGVIVNNGAIIDHDCTVAPWAHLGPNASLGGDVTVREGAFIGAGAVVLPGVKIEGWSTVGAGAVVTRNVAAHTVVMGIPARESRSQ